LPCAGVSGDSGPGALALLGKADRTRRAYQDGVGAFLPDKSLRHITLADLVTLGETLGKMAPASRTRKVGAVKSLAAFGHRIGYLASISARRCGCQQSGRHAPAAHPRGPST
jgi:hypothetical protein